MDIIMQNYHLTIPQQNIWNLQKFYQDTAVSNLCGAIFYNEKRDSEKLCQVITCFVKNQSGIRLRFEEKEEVIQYVSEEVDAEIPVREFASREALEEYAEQFAQKPIGLTGGKLYRFEVFQLENQSGILVVLSHLIADAWTFGLMAKQVDELFHTLQCGNAVSVQQADYTEFIRAEKEYLASEKYQKDKEYWENKYAVRPETSMVKLCPGIPGKITSRRICRTLSYALEETIQLFCSQNSITPAVLFETALIVYLSKINAENQTITIGIPVLNRSNVREKSIAGMFISTMPLTVTVEPGMAVLELAKRITRIHREIFRHQKYPYSNILTSLREKQNFSGNLYEVMVSYQNARTDTDAETKWYSNGACEIPLEVHIDNRDGGDSHTINIDYQTAVFTEQEVNYLLDRLEYILEQMAEESTRLLRDISIVPEKELKKILEEFNDTRVEYPQDKCIHELFMEQVERTPEKTALVDADGIISYKELDFLSNCFAYGLTEKGVGIGDVVAFALSRKIHMIAVILGILKCGAAYMPIDRRYPKNRINYMLAESNAKIFITEKNYKEYLQYTDARRFSIEINSTNPCYCIYTSGSTGVPKGIVMCHRGIVNLLKYKKLYSVMDKCKNIALLTTITFDVATQEIFTALLNGYTGYLFNEKSDMSISEVITMLQKYQIDMFFCSPSYLNILCEKYSDADKVLNIVKCINLAGERFYVNENIKECSRQYDVAFENQYGPAETHVITATRIKNFTNITIGKPIANTQIYILDWNGAPLPIGVAGELCIAGDGVGLGYLNRPELTAERFVENPFATAENYHGKVMYHTGDLARWREDGEIEYLGRMDTQVKIRGLRIELGEIESVMAGFPGIQLAAVADKKEENGRQYLVGYYTAEQELDVHQLREHLANKLPNYMVPNYFVHLETMPMTASGKTDRRNLPIPDTNMQKETYVEPETETEKKLAGIWMELLKVEKVSRRDDFFELGGDSLLAIALLNEIAEAFFVEPFIKDVMERSSLEQLALCIEQYIKQVTGKEERINPCGKNRYVLLPQQKAIYAACQKERDSLQYNMPARLLLSDKVDREKLKHSICRVVKHHKILSSCIAAEGEALYGVYDKTAEPVFENYTKGTEDSFVRAFDLQKAPLLHVGFTEDALLFDIHHIIADGGTLNIMLRDIIRVYEGRELLENEVWYGDYAEYFAGCDFAGGKAYFQEKLACELEKLELPLTRCGRKGGASRFYQIPEQIVSGAGRYGAKHQLTDTMVFLGAYGILLSRYSAKKNILSSIILKNRIHRETRDMAGMFVNTLPVNLEVEGSIQEYFQKVKELLLNQYQYQELPFLEIADAVGMNDKTVVNTSFVYQADGELKLVLDGQMLQPEIIETGTSKFDLSMELTPVGQGMKLRLEYNCEKYDDRLMDRLAESYMRILTQLEKNFLSEVTVLSAGEYKQIVEEFNDTRVEYPQDKCIHELFMEQVERTPEKTALVFEEKEFTYRELDEMSNSLAHFLREKGVTVGDRVAVLMQRDERVIMAQLAVLKLGAVFIPIDSRYPKDRVEYILAESGAALIVKNRDNEMSFPTECWIEEWNYSGKTDVVSAGQCGEAAYIIFTSGSTGQPKGCMLTNRGLVNFCRNNNILQKCNQLEKQVCVSVNTISFDYFIAESLLPLANGYTVVLANEAESVNQELFAELVVKNGVNIIQTTPTRYKLYFSKKGDLSYTRQFQVIVTSGEALPVELLQTFVEHTDAAIFNPLGPSECSVWAVGGELHPEGENVSAEDITIGKPIANTQIYILDWNGAPLPIGVAGELCIAGDGVGLGYLNRPELTAERFVENPFATAENHHGKVMYHTGDLARWREDGEIEYLGRMDTQVKIRGLRIELGEIESVMAGFPGIQLAAVADKKEENGRQYLVGYYTAEQELDVHQLREHLANKLPNYMVPNYFVNLETMPMTASGKTDRRNLPIPDTTVQKETYVEPETGREKLLCRLMEEVLGVEKVGMTDDFFERGGDSLSAMEYIAKAHDAGMILPLQVIFDCPTVRALCGYLESGRGEKAHYEASMFEKYQKVLSANVVDETFIPVKKALGNVLLTGATGFLGAHILDYLMREESGKIYCLIRSERKDDRRGRLLETLNYYFGGKYEQEIGRRIIPVIGDIEKETLADEMPADVQTVIHTAASVKHYGSHEYFHRVNCEGTKHVVNYAGKIGAKLIHISTISVSGNTMADDFTVYRSEEEKHFSEQSLYIGQPLENVYVQSKFEAERVVYDAILSGLDAKVIRVGNLTNRLGDFKFQPNYEKNAFLTRVKALLEFGQFPEYLMTLYAEFSPVDLTAEGIVRIAQYAGNQTVFHLNSNRPVYFERFQEVIHQLGISMKVVNGGDFYKALQQTIKKAGTEYIFEAFQNDMDEQGNLVYDSNIHIENEFTVWFLQRVGFEWNETDVDYIKGYIAYFRELGYLRV